MRNKYYFSLDGHTVIDLSRVSAITQNHHKSCLWTVYLNSGVVIEIDGGTVAELMDALSEFVSPRKNNN